MNQDILKAIRGLAKSNEYQLIYSQAKEIGLKLFHNNINFTAIQLLFLKWLKVYNILNNDLMMGKEYIDEEVIEDDILADAYLTYRRKKSKEEEKDKEKDNGVNVSGAPGMTFVNKD